MLNKKEICCLIITYNPTDDLLNLLRIIEGQVDSVIIVDNSSEFIFLKMLTPMIKNKGLHIIQNKQNLGIAKALNQGCGIAKELNYKWVLTFDQDSTPFNNIVEIISEVYSFCPYKIKIGAIGVNYMLKSKQLRFNTSKNRKYNTRDYLITSGCLYSILAISEIGGFREDFFIDNVDLEYSLRLRKNKYVLLNTSECGMVHQAGTPENRQFFGKSVSPSNHNVFRRYYMARNHIIITKEYLMRFPYFIAKTNLFFLISILEILLFEKDKKLKLVTSYEGLKDGLSYSIKENRRHNFLFHEN